MLSKRVASLAKRAGYNIWTWLLIEEQDRFTYKVTARARVGHGGGMDMIYRMKSMVEDLYRLAEKGLDQIDEFKPEQGGGTEPYIYWETGYLFMDIEGTYEVVGDPPGTDPDELEEQGMEKWQIEEEMEAAWEAWHAQVHDALGPALREADEYEVTLPGE